MRSKFDLTDTTAFKEQIGERVFSNIKALQQPKPSEGVIYAVPPQFIGQMPDLVDL